MKRAIVISSVMLAVVASIGSTVVVLYHGPAVATSPYVNITDYTYAPLYHHDFEETNATGYVDASAAGNDLVAGPTVADPTWTVVGSNVYGRIERCVVTDNNDDYLRVIVTGLVVSNKGYTVHYWWYGDQEGGYGEMFSCVDDDTDEKSYLRATVNDGAYDIDFMRREEGGNGNLRRRVDNESGYFNSAWHCFQLVDTGGGTSGALQVWIDGSQADEQDASSGYDAGQEEADPCTNYWACYMPYGSYPQYRGDGWDCLIMWTGVVSQAARDSIREATHPTNNLIAR